MNRNRSSLEPLPLDPAGADFHTEIHRIRARGPLAVIELPGGVPAWSVIDADLLRTLFTDPRVSKDAGRHWPAMHTGEIPQDWVMWPWVAVSNLLTAYGDDHRRLRKLVAPAFTHRRTESLRPRIEGITADLLNALAATPADEQVDLRERFATALPIRVIGELMGVPAELSASLRTYADGTLDTTLTPEQSQANFAGLYTTLHELLDYKRRNPGDDLTTVLMSTHDEDGSKLSEQELGDTLLLIIVAGHETTANLLDHAVHALLTHPEQRAAALSGQLAWTDIIEETLRWEPPIAHMPMRFALEDIDLPGGYRIEKGDAILAGLAGAGRDPKVHPGNPDDFDPTRPAKDHLAFGHGVHHCLGAPLARLEATVALPALFARFPEMRLATTDHLDNVPSLVTNGHRTLPVVL
ncbi:cytochrome P450 family protein [Nocardia sp. NBC_00416]|uniref:cytochrome P450 family protein n=1 Tax=Nocardia sp. NBC_00416 TaxID=2975991 RepID=UPI002E1E13BD